jgi:dGTPase
MLRNPLDQTVYRKRTHDRPQDVRGDYFRDQTAIIHSTAFRRLKHKTQVFFSPENDHVCTRIEHELHVATIAATICKGLVEEGGWELDIDMAYAIGLGHDIGHAPFGHAGETKLAEIMLPQNYLFAHEINSYRVVEHIAGHGAGLNLTYGVKNGIIFHNGEKIEQTLKPDDVARDLERVNDRTGKPCSYEGCAVRFADKIAYLGRDIEDAILAHFIRRDDVPEIIRGELGETNGQIINTLVMDVINSSVRAGDTICLSDEKFDLLNQLYEFNKKTIYYHEEIERYKKYCQSIVEQLFQYLADCYCRYGDEYQRYDQDPVPMVRRFGLYLQEMDEFYRRPESQAPNLRIMDYVAGMTDVYALDCMRQITLPEPIQFGTGNTTRA